MEEKKNKLGVVEVEMNGTVERWNIVSALVGAFKGERRVAIGKTDHDTYTLQVKRPTENEGVVEQTMHLTKGSLSSLLACIHLFLEHENEDLARFAAICQDEDSGYLYKREGEEES